MYVEFVTNSTGLLKNREQNAYIVPETSYYFLQFQKTFLLVLKISKLFSVTDMARITHLENY